MALTSQVAAIYNKEVNSGNIRLKRWPANLAGVTVTPGTLAGAAMGTYVQVVAAATIANPSWLVSVALSTFTGVAAEGEFAFDVSTTVSAVGTLSNQQGVVSVAVEFQTAVGSPALPNLNLAVPIRIAGAPLLAAAAENMTGPAQPTFKVALILGEGLGT